MSYFPYAEDFQTCIPIASLPSPRSVHPPTCWPSHLSATNTPEAQQLQKLKSSSSTSCPTPSLLLIALTCLTSGVVLPPILLPKLESGKYLQALVWNHFSLSPLPPAYSRPPLFLHLPCCTGLFSFPQVFLLQYIFCLSELVERTPVAKILLQWLPLSLGLSLNSSPW